MLLRCASRTANMIKCGAFPSVSVCVCVFACVHMQR